MSSNRLLFTRAVLFLGSCALFFLACEETIEPNLNIPDPQLSVSANLAFGEFVEVRLSSTQTIFETQPVGVIANARVDLFVDGVFTERLPFLARGGRLDSIYRSQKVLPEVGRTYNLEITAPNFEPIFASTSIPDTVPFALMVHNVEEMDGRENTESSVSYRVAIDYLDPPGQANFYQLDFYQEFIEFNVIDKDTSFTGLNSYPLIFNSLGDNNNYLPAVTGGLLIEDKPFSGPLIFDLSIPINRKTQKLGRLVAELRTVSEEYYQYYASVSRQQNSGNGGINTPVFIISNIENGVGVFAGYNTSRASEVVSHE